MKKFVAIAGVVSLVSTVALAREAEPTIEINVDVLQGLVPPAPVAQPQPVATPTATPAKKAAAKKHKTTKRKKAAHKKIVAEKKTAPAKVVKEEPALVVEPLAPIEKKAAPEIPAVTTPPIPNAETKVEAPKAAENVAPPAEASAAPVEAPKTDVVTPAAAPTEAPKVEEKPAESAPAVALPVTGQGAEVETKTFDDWLLKADEWRDHFKQWIAEKKEAITGTPAEKPVVAPTPEKQAEIKAIENNIPAVPATDQAPEKPKTADADMAPAANPVVEKTLAEAAKTPATDAAKPAPISAPVDLKTERAKDAAAAAPVVAVETIKPAPLTVPAEEKAPVKEEVKAPVISPVTEAEHLQEATDSLLLKIDRWKTRFKQWLENAVKPVPATTPTPKAEVKLPEAIKTTEPTLASPAAPTEVIAVPAVQVKKPEEVTKKAPVAVPGTVITPPSAPLEMKPHEVTSIGSPRKPLYTVLFAGSVDEIAEADMAPINALSEKLQQEKDTRITVLGYAPQIDGLQESDARKLSLKRAIAVRQLLIKQGINATRINVRALGSDTQEVVKDRVDIVKMR